jgi:acyl-coenzyme A synthetase/AMP-(fatty) acid ligase
LNYMAKFDVVRQDDFPTLKRLLWCGEVFPTPRLIYWMKRIPRAQFTNLYGPTETTVASSYYTVPACPEDPNAQIPIGVSCEGEELLVLDDAMRRCAPGETGNLYIRGVGLSAGYWLDEEKTRAMFIPNPFAPVPGDRLYRTGDLARVENDGLVYFLGRSDSQIKSRGYRIELGEIEAALSTLPELAESAVVAVQLEGFEGATICCGYVSVAAGRATPSLLKKRLGKTVPSYMIPARWRAYDKLPQNANGKIDRRRLREQFEETDAPDI